jgi:nucleoside-diphosphate-sugar epimerase
MPTVMITGADGYLGKRLTKQFLTHSDESLLLWVRAKDAQEFKTKQESLLQNLNSMASRIVVKAGNLTDEHPFDHTGEFGIGPNAKELKTIIHCAAITRFNVEENIAHSVNIEGNHKLMQFAKTCPNLEQFALVSSVYASGLRAGSIDEINYDNSAGFANYYESSKWACENDLTTHFNDLPWQIYRVATVIANNNEGTVTQQNAFHNTLRLFYYGLLSLIPGNRETPLYFISGDFASDAIYRGLKQNDKHKIYHVCHQKQESLTLGQLIDISFDTFSDDNNFKVRRILKPLYSDAESFSLLAESITSMNEGILGQAVSSVSPFSRQLFIDKNVHNENMRTLMNGYMPPDAAQFISNTCRHLVKTKWGRVPA